MCKYETKPQGLSARSEENPEGTALPALRSQPELAIQRFAIQTFILQGLSPSLDHRPPPERARRVGEKAVGRTLLQVECGVVDPGNRRNNIWISLFALFASLFGVLFWGVYHLTYVG